MLLSYKHALLNTFFEKWVKKYLGNKNYGEKAYICTFLGVL